MSFNLWLWLIVFFSWSQVGSETIFEGNWTYMEYGGTKGWNSRYPTCNGQKQSPVDIITALTFSKKYKPIKIENYDTASAIMIFDNNGRTVNGMFPKDPKAIISGGGLAVKYYAHSFHFHWGTNDGSGSEHYKDGTSFPMELHIIHYSSKYATFEEAKTQADGVAIFCFFFTIGIVNNTILQNLIGKFPLIEAVGSNTKVDGQLNLLIPKNLEKFYRYTGSFSIPPCSETVIWTIFESTISVSSRQLKEFRTRLKWSSSSVLPKMAGNFREIRPLYQRKIYVSNAGSVHHGTLIVNLMIIGVQFYHTYLQTK